MKVAKLLDILKEYDADDEIVQCFSIKVSDGKAVVGYMDLEGFRRITIKEKDGYFVDAGDGKEALCLF